MNSTASSEAAAGLTGSTSYAVKDTAFYSIVLQVTNDVVPVDGNIKISNVSIAQQYFVYKYQCLVITARLLKGTSIAFQFNNASTAGIFIVTKLT